MLCFGAEESGFNENLLLSKSKSFTFGFPLSKTVKHYLLHWQQITPVALQIYMTFWKTLQDRFPGLVNAPV